MSLKKGNPSRLPGKWDARRRAGAFWVNWLTANSTALSSMTPTSKVISTQCHRCRLSVHHFSQYCHQVSRQCHHLERRYHWKPREQFSWRRHCEARGQALPTCLSCKPWDGNPKSSIPCSNVWPRWRVPWWHIYQVTLHNLMEQQDYLTRQYAQIQTDPGMASKTKDFHI